MLFIPGSGLISAEPLLWSLGCPDAVIGLPVHCGMMVIELPASGGAREGDGCSVEDTSVSEFLKFVLLICLSVS